MTSIFDTLLVENDTKLVQEDDMGNIEYKLTLETKTKNGIEKLISQLIWRMREGKRLHCRYEAHYILGVYDNGIFGGQSVEALTKTIEVFRDIVNKAEGEIAFGKRYTFNINYIESNIIYLIVRRALDKRKINEYTTLIVGDGGVGKTSLISRLTYGQIDNGNGFSRKLVMKHQHEKNSGASSSLKKDIIGFKNTELINYSCGLEGYSWEDILKESNRIVSIFDTPGNLRYIRTTLHAITSIKPDAIILMIDTRATKLSDLNKFFLEFFKSENTSILVVLSKSDIGSINDDLINEIKTYPIDDIISISNITDQGIDNVLNYLQRLRKRPMMRKINFVFTVYDLFAIPDRGNIIAGYADSGKILLGQTVYVHNDNETFPAKIMSICKKQIDCKSINQGESGTLQLSCSDNIDKHVLITDDKYEPMRLPIMKIKIVYGKEFIKNGSVYLLIMKNNTYSVKITESINDLITIETHNGLPMLIHIGSKIILKSDKAELMFGVN